MELTDISLPDWAKAYSPGTAPSAEWVGSTVRTGDVTSGYSMASPLTQFVQRARQYVLICGSLVARVCASQPFRVYNKSKKAPSKTRKSAVEKVRYSKRLKYLKDATCVGTKAAEYAAWAEDVEEVPDSPLLWLLRRPNPFMLGTEFVEGMFQGNQFAGNYFNYFTEESGQPELYPMLPQFVRAIPDEMQFIKGYLYFRDGADPSTFTGDEVMHGRYAPNPFNPFYGLCPLQSAIVESDLCDAATVAEWHRWKRGGRPDFAIETTAPQTQTQLDQIRASVRRDHQGVHNTGAFMVLSQAKINPIGFAPKEMEYIAGMNHSEEVIQNAYGVPKSLLALNDANLASSLTGHAQFMRQTIRPQLSRMAEYWTEWLCPKFGIEPGEVWICFDDPVPEDEKAENDSLIAATNAGHMTLNEARAVRGLDPYDPEVGDTVRINGTSVEKLDAPPPAPMMPPPNNQSVNVTPADKEDHEAVAKSVVSVLDTRRAKSLAHAWARAAPHWYGKHVHHVHTKDDDKLRLRKPDGVNGWIDAMSEDLEKWYREVYTAGLASVEMGMPVNLGADDAALNRILAAFLPKILEEAAKQAASSIPNGSFDVIPENALEFLRGYQIRLAQNVTQGVAQGMNDVLSAGLSDGLTVRQIADGLREQIPDASAYRAERIARTESAYVMGRGRLIGWKENGVAQKEWLLSGNPCALCEEVKATHPGPIAVDALFFAPDEWSDGLHEPRHPNCTCNTVAVFGAPATPGADEQPTRTADGVVVPGSVLAEGEG